MKCVRAYLRDSFFFLCGDSCYWWLELWCCGDDDDDGKCAESRAKLLMPYFSMSLLRYLKLSSYRSDRPRFLHSQLTSLYVIYNTKKLRICKTNHVNKSQKIDFVRALFDQSVIWIWCHFTADLFLHQSAAINIFLLSPFPHQTNNNQRGILTKFLRYLAKTTC